MVPMPNASVRRSGSEDVPLLLLIRRLSLGQVRRRPFIRYPICRFRSLSLFLSPNVHHYQHARLSSSNPP